MSSIARRYARALYEEAERTEKIDAADRDVELIRESLEGAPELVRLFRSPVVPREKKQAVVATLFADRIDPLTLRFLGMLIEKQREEIFPDVVRAYHRMKDQRLGIVEAKARVAHALPEAERSLLVDTLERLTGKTVRLELEEDETLIGGIVVRVGDVVYDGTVRHHLERLRRRLEVGAYVLN